MLRLGTVYSNMVDIMVSFLGVDTSKCSVLSTDSNKYVCVFQQSQADLKVGVSACLVDCLCAPKCVLVVVVCLTLRQPVKSS